MARIGFTKCYHCQREQRTSAKIGNRIACRFCDRSFEVKIKLDRRPTDIPMKFNYTTADKLVRSKRRLNDR